MTGWTDLTGSTSSFFGGGWAADLGPYTGPTSDLAAPPFLPGGASEVDYIVGPPNPDGLVADFRDGTYPASDWFDSGRFVNTFGGGGAEIVFDGGPVGVAGLHLMVAWYGPSAPDMPPEALVPVGWATGAALDIGHWSDWFDNDIATAAVTDARNGGIYSNGVIQNNTPSTDAAGAMTTVLATARTGSTGIHYANTPLDVLLDTSKFASDVSPAYQFQASASLSQEMLTLIAPAPPALAPPPGLLDGLTEGRDYGPNPYTGEDLDYESGAPEFLGWSDFPMKTVGGYSLAIASWPSSGSAERVPEGLVIAEVTYRAVTTALLPEDRLGTGVTHVADWQDYEVGVEVGHATTTIPDPVPVTGFGSGERIAEPVIGTGAPQHRHTLTLSDLGAEPEITLISQSNYQSTDVAQPFDDYTVVPFGDPSWESNVENHEFHEDKQIFIRLWSFWGNVSDDGNFRDDETFTPQARFQQPRVRYWIPAPQWHTVGGHWATQSADVPLRILTPLPAGGSRWVDVVDGPA